MNASLYFDGARYFLVPNDAPRSSRGHEAWTVAGEERRLTPEQLTAFEVDEAAADAFIAIEVQDATARVIPVIGELFSNLPRQPDPREMQALLGGVEDTLSAVLRGDAAAIDRFRERARKVSAVIATQGRPELAEVVRLLPDRLVELLGRPG